jgi:hypothetical protein
LFELQQNKKRAEGSRHFTSLIAQLRKSSRSNTAELCLRVRLLADPSAMWKESDPVDLMHESAPLQSSDRRRSP